MVKIAELVGCSQGASRGQPIVWACVLCLLVSCEQSADSGLAVSRLTLSQPCDIRQGCRAENESLTAIVTFEDEPRALQAFPIRIQLRGERRVDAVTAAFSMQGMNMGPNRYRFIADSSDGWRADITLPICASGRTDWLAQFELAVAGQRVQFEVPFVLHK
jgi:hypothetical protein